MSRASKKESEIITTEKRNITKEDIFLEARLRSEGARIEMKKTATSGHSYLAVVMDECDIVIGIWHNPSSHLLVSFDGDVVTISEMGKVLGTGRPEVRPSWRDNLCSDGTTAQDALPMWNADIASIFLSVPCFHALGGKPCKYCIVSSTPTSAMPTRDPSDFEARKTRNVEAVGIALKNGWRGTILFTGGTPKPTPLRHEQLTDEMEKIIKQLRKSVGDKILSQNHISEALFSPPEDLGLLQRWKDIGLNSTEFDTQIVAPEYFKAICPGRGEQNRWTEAQAASADIFGRGRGATTGIVMGLEPMDGLLKGIEERISKGVFTQLFNFIPILGTPYGGMMPPSARWFQIAAEKIVDIYLRYADTFEVDLTEDTRFGYTRKGRSFYLSIVDDEMSRRLQEMGKLEPGLPKQDGMELK